MHEGGAAKDFEHIPSAGAHADANEHVSVGAHVHGAEHTSSAGMHVCRAEHNPKGAIHEYIAKDTGNSKVPAAVRCSDSFANNKKAPCKA